MAEQIQWILQTGAPGLEAGQYQGEYFEFDEQTMTYIINQTQFPAPGNRRVHGFLVPGNTEKRFGVSSTFINGTTGFHLVVNELGYNKIVLVFTSPGDEYSFRTQLDTLVFAVEDVNRFKETIVVYRTKGFTIAAKPGAQFQLEYRGENWNPNIELQVEPAIYRPATQRITTVNCRPNTTRQVKIGPIGFNPTSAMYASIIHIIPEDN